jgi:hypothetical protein
MLGGNAGFAAADAGSLPAGFELIEDFAHVSPKSAREGGPFALNGRHAESSNNLAIPNHHKSTASAAAYSEPPRKEHYAKPPIDCLI